MSTLRVPMSDLAPGERDLDADQSRYVVRVHRLRKGDRFVAFDPARGVECDAELVAHAKGAARVALGEVRDARAGATRSITWIHGCPKGDKADAIVRDATELGATKIVFVHTARIVAKPHVSRALRWSRVAREAARQSGRSDAPDVSLASSWEEALDACDAETRVCLDPRGAPIRDVLASIETRPRGSIAFAAGPEGGFDAREIEAAEKRGFVVCRLGTFVMRTETVPAAALGALAALSSVL